MMERYSGNKDKILYIPDSLVLHGDKGHLHILATLIPKKQSPVHTEEDTSGSGGEGNVEPI
jgi:hypothetical protein